MLELTGKLALVTGGASGIGAGVIVALQAQGLRVASLDLQPGGPADVRVACDVADEQSVVAATADAVGQLGGLHYAFCNAGVAGMGSILTMPMAEYDRVMNINLRGVVLTLREAAKAIRDSGQGGAIVCTASSAGIMADIGMVHYSLAKMGVRQLVRVAARELAVHGIRVNAVAPGPTVTPMLDGAAEMTGYFEHLAAITPLGRLGTVEDIVDAVLALFALKWVTGQTLAADGGVTVCSSTDVPGIDAEALASW